MVFVNVARVLVHQVLHLILAVEHQHECDNWKCAASTRSQIALAAAGVGLEDGNKLLDVTAFDSFARFSVNLTGVNIRRVV